VSSEASATSLNLPSQIPCLTIRAMPALAIMAGIKVFENRERNFRRDYVGPMAIHVAKAAPSDDEIADCSRAFAEIVADCDDSDPPQFTTALPPGLVLNPSTAPYGHIVGFVDIVRMFTFDVKYPETMPPELNENEHSDVLDRLAWNAGIEAFGPLCIQLDNPRWIKPVPHKGKLGWDNVSTAGWTLIDEPANLFLEVDGGEDAAKAVEIDN